MTSLDWGSVPEWVAAVAAVLAVVFAAISVFLTTRAVRSSREANQVALAAYKADMKQRREAQARFVSSTAVILGQITPGQPVYTDGDVVFPGGIAEHDHNGNWIGRANGLVVKITLHNGSDELIGPFSIGVYDYELDETTANSTRVSSRDPLLPGESYSTSIGVATEHGRGHLLRGDIVFRDSSGEVWRRRGAEPIEELEDQPPWTVSFGP